MTEYVVHASIDEDLKVALCGQRRSGHSKVMPTHMMHRASSVLAKRFSKEFRDGRKYDDGGRISMRFCLDCLNHEDLEMIALAEV